MSQGDSKQWVVVELSHQGEKRSPDEIRVLLSQCVGGGVEVFVPALTFRRKDSCVTLYVMEGYVFIEAGLSTDRYFDLEDTVYVRSVLSKEEPSGRYLRYVPNSTVRELEERLAELAARKIERGDRVRITEGSFSQLVGEIRDVWPETSTATVHVVDLESMEVIVELPFQFLEPCDLPEGAQEAPSSHDEEGE